MIPSSQAFDTVVSKTSRTWLAHVYACTEATLSGGIDLGTSNVVAFTLKRGLCGDSFVPGGVFIPSATVQVQDNGLTTAQREALMEAYALRIELWLFDDEPVQAIPFNQLVVVNRKKQSDLWTLECSGRLSQVLDTTYTSSLTYPALLPDVITELDNWFYSNWGLRLEVIPDDGAGDEATIDKSLSGLTVKEALEVVASLMRSWVTQTNTGAPVIARAGWGDIVDVPANRSITPPEYGDWYEVTGIECIVKEAQESPDGTVIPAVTFSDSQSPNIIMENSYMTQSMWDAYAGIFDGVGFEPATVEMTLGDPRIDPWDLLEVYDIEGTAHIVPCLNVTHQYNGGLSTTVAAPVPTTGESTVTIVGPVERAVKTLQRQVGYLQVAGQNAQYFWHNESDPDVSTGTYITEVPEATFRANPANGGGNTLLRSNGIALRHGLTELAVLRQAGMTINSYDGNGNLVPIANLGYGPGTDGTGGISDAPFYTLGTRQASSTVGNYSVAEGDGTTASGHASHAEGTLTVAGGLYGTHAEGWGTSSTGLASHAEGSGTTASGVYGAHAEGNGTEASGVTSHAEGHATKATGAFSHAQGMETIAAKEAQTALGTYNVEDTAATTTHPDGSRDYGEYAVIIGNGVSDSARNNALTVDWDGAVVAAGPITAQGHSSAIGTIENVSATVSVSSGTSWGRKADTALQVDPGTWLVIASASCPGSTTGDRALGITYGSSTGNLAQSRTTMRANAGSGIAAMQTTMVVATNTAARTYAIEYWQNSNAAKSVDFRLTAVRLA